MVHGGWAQAGMRRRWSVADALTDPAIRISITFLVVAQLLDVLTTLTGFVRGLPELNPVALSLVGHLGPFGLLVQKVGVVAAVLLATAMLPPRLSSLAWWSFTLLMAGIVASNCALLLGTHPA